MILLDFTGALLKDFPSKPATARSSKDREEFVRFLREQGKMGWPQIYCDRVEVDNQRLFGCCLVDKEGMVPKSSYRMGGFTLERAVAGLLDRKPRSIDEFKQATERVRTVQGAEPLVGEIQAMSQNHAFGPKRSSVLQEPGAAGLRRGLRGPPSAD